MADTTQTMLGQTLTPTLARLARSLLDLEDDHLGWDKVKPSFSYKQRAWVNAAEQLVAAPVADPVAELSVLQKLTLQLQAAIKPAALPSWFRLSLPRWKSAVSSAADVATLHEAIVILGAACRAEEPPSPEWKTEQPPAMPEGCVVVKTEVKAEDKQQVPAWPVDAYVEVQVKQEVKQERLEPLAPVVRQGAAGSSGKTNMQAAPHMRRRPASPGEASDEEPAAPGSAKRARTSSGDGPVQPGSAGAREEAASAPGWEQEPLDELDDEGGGGGGGGGAGWLPDPMGVDSDDEGGAGPAGADEEDRAMTPERDAEEEDEEDDGEEDDGEEDEVSSEEDSDDGSAHVSEADSEEEEGALRLTLTLTLTLVRRDSSPRAGRKRPTRRVRPLAAQTMQTMPRTASRTRRSLVVAAELPPRAAAQATRRRRRSRGRAPCSRRRGCRARTATRKTRAPPRMRQSAASRVARSPTRARTSTLPRRDTSLTLTPTLTPTLTLTPTPTLNPTLTPTRYAAPLPPEYRYFPDAPRLGGADALDDYCPTWVR